MNYDQIKTNGSFMRQISRNLSLYSYEESLYLCVNDRCILIMINFSSSKISDVIITPSAMYILSSEDIIRYSEKGTIAISRPTGYGQILVVKNLCHLIAERQVTVFDEEMVQCGQYEISAEFSKQQRIQMFNGDVFSIANQNVVQLTCEGNIEQNVTNLIRSKTHKYEWPDQAILVNEYNNSYLVLNPINMEYSFVKQKFVEYGPLKLRTDNFNDQNISVLVQKLPLQQKDVNKQALRAPQRYLEHFSCSKTPQQANIVRKIFEQGTIGFYVAEKSLLLVCNNDAVELIINIHKFTSNIVASQSAIYLQNAEFLFRVDCVDTIQIQVAKDQQLFVTNDICIVVSSQQRNNQQNITILDKNLRTLNNYKEVRKTIFIQGRFCNEAFAIQNDKLHLVKISDKYQINLVEIEQLYKPDAAWLLEAALVHELDDKIYLVDVNIKSFAALSKRQQIVEMKYIRQQSSHIEMVYVLNNQLVQHRARNKIERSQSNSPNITMPKKSDEVSYGQSKLFKQVEVYNKLAFSIFKNSGLYLLNNQVYLVHNEQAVQISEYYVQPLEYVVFTSRSIFLLCYTFGTKSMIKISQHCSRIVDVPDDAKMFFVIDEYCIVVLPKKLLLYNSNLQFISELNQSVFNGFELIQCDDNVLLVDAFQLYLLTNPLDLTHMTPVPFQTESNISWMQSARLVVIRNTGDIICTNSDKKWVILSQYQQFDDSNVLIQRQQIYNLEQALKCNIVQNLFSNMVYSYIQQQHMSNINTLSNSNIPIKVDQECLFTVCQNQIIILAKQVVVSYYEIINKDQFLGQLDEVSSNMSVLRFQNTIYHTTKTGLQKLYEMSSNAQHFVLNQQVYVYSSYRILKIVSGRAEPINSKISDQLDWNNKFFTFGKHIIVHSGNKILKLDGTGKECKDLDGSRKISKVDQVCDSALIVAFNDQAGDPYCLVDMVDENVQTFRSPEQYNSILSQTSTNQQQLISAVLGQVFTDNRTSHIKQCEQQEDVAGFKQFCREKMTENPQQLMNKIVETGLKNNTSLRRSQRIQKIIRMCHKVRWSVEVK